MSRNSREYAGKRALDIALSVVGALLLSPVMAVASLTVKLSSPGPVLYRAERAGRFGVPITVLKFRSMRTSNAGAAVTAANDSRITPVGRTLRMLKIDELPQLWNVLVGDMSIVGPRPEDFVYVDRYDALQTRILDWRPGLTSPASLRYRHEESLLGEADDLETTYWEIAAAKIEIDLGYFRHSTLRGDIGIIVKTIAAIFDHDEGADDHSDQAIDSAP